MQEQNNFCALCKKVAKQRCSACQAVHYCSREHQVSHWKTHSKNCRAYKLVENSQLGRHYVATRNIKVGETVIYDAAPLITAPGYMRAIKIGKGNFSVSLEAPPVCLSCYDVLTVGTAYPCDKCGWPLCHRCTEHGAECEFTIKHRGSKVKISSQEYKKPHPAYEIIGVIRALVLRENDPKSYKNLMDHQDLTEFTPEIDSQDSIGKAARFAKTFLNIKDVQEAEICKIIGIIWLNSLKIKTQRSPHAAVHDLGSYIEHNCLPNCSKTTTDKGGVIFWAAVPISKGDHITTTYVKPFLGAKQRRQYLSSAKFFDCCCERCKDPTEFDTMFNAIKCTKDDCNGYALPPTFAVTGQNYADFVCRTCNRTVPRILSDEMERCIMIEKANLMTDNVWQYQQFIRKYTEHLHENNSHIFEVELDIVLAFAYNLDGLKMISKEYIADIVKLCDKLTQLLKVIAPAENTMRATVLYVKITANLFTGESWTFRKKCAMSKAMQKDLNKAEQLLSRESACHPFEYSMLQACRVYLVKLEMFDNMRK